MRTKLLSFLLLTLFATTVVNAQFGNAWKRSPAITVIYANKDERIGLVDEAIAFWNKTFEEVGSGFRLPKANLVKGNIPETELQALSQSVVGGSRAVEFPKAFHELPGELNIFLGDSEFVSFASPFDQNGKRVVGIRGRNFPPLSLPNVARNVIIHEIGHAIGLGHNSDPTMLMCGRPSPCRPALFAAPKARVFPLSDEERNQLTRMYPVDWKPIKK